MKPMNLFKVSCFGDYKAQKNLLYTTLVTATLLVGSKAQASTVQALTQYCQAGDVFVPSDKICAATLDTSVNGISVPIILDATAYHADTDQVEYNLLNPILLTIPGSDGDQVKLNKVSLFLDPTLKFEASFVDFAEPSPFNVTFTSFPFAPNIFIKSSLSGLLTDNSAPQDGVSLTTQQLVTYDFLDATGNVVNSFNLGSQASFPAGPPDIHLYGPLAGGSALNCDTVGCGRVKLSLAFTGSGGGDSYDFTSRSDVTAAVPEPSAILGVLSIGLGSLFGFKRKGNSKK